MLSTALTTDPFTAHAAMPRRRCRPCPLRRGAGPCHYLGSVRGVTELQFLPGDVQWCLRITLALAHGRGRLQSGTHPGFPPAGESLVKLSLRGCWQRTAPLPVLELAALVWAWAQGILLVYASVFTLFTTTGKIQSLNKFITVVPVIHVIKQNRTGRADTGLPCWAEGEDNINYTGRLTTFFSSPYQRH